MIVNPASADYGIWFRRTDVLALDPLVPARWDAVIPSRLCTLLSNPAGVTVSTVEHIMAALAGFVVFYLALYWRIVRFRSPGWLHAARRRLLPRRA